MDTSSGGFQGWHATTGLISLRFKAREGRPPALLMEARRALHPCADFGEDLFIKIQRAVALSVPAIDRSRAKGVGHALCHKRIRKRTKNGGDPGIARYADGKITGFLPGDKLGEDDHRLLDVSLFSRLLS